MTYNSSHPLIEEFPEFRENIHRLKMTDRHFAKLFDEYDLVAHAVHRIEAGAEAASDERLEDLKKRRLRLKDNLFRRLHETA